MFKKFVVKNQPANQSSRIGIQVLLIGIAMLTLGQCAGCKLGIKDAAMLTYRDTVWSKRAYNLRYGNCEREYSNHFENGFCAGYREMSNGGDGYVPALPPQQYRAAEYQSTDGAKCVNSWFEGYPAGVAAAKKDRSGTYHDVLISRMINSAVKQANTQPVLPGDVKVVSADQADGNENGDQEAITKPTTQSQYSPLNSMPSILQPATYDVPPQAYSIPAELPRFALPEVVSTDYAEPTQAPVESKPVQSVGTGKLTTEPTDTVDNVDQLQQLPAQVAPVNWTPTFK